MSSCPELWRGGLVGSELKYEDLAGSTEEVFFTSGEQVSLFAADG